MKVSHAGAPSMRLRSMPRPPCVHVDRDIPGIRCRASNDCPPSLMRLDHVGRYQIIEELGRGAMGVVYKARDPLLERTVAIKTVDLTLTHEEAKSFEQRFYREAKSAGSLNHVIIFTIYDVGKKEVFFFF